jgi:CheY-like chemotaxis protein/HPt (histidine-containing phosphotransfer) domain-containing protein
VVVDQRLGLDGLRKSARLAREAADRSEVQLCVLVPPGPVRAWEVEGPERTAYVTKPAGRRKIASVVAQSRAPGVVEGPPAESEKALPSTGRILLVEDNEANWQYAMRVLEGAGYQMTLATNGTEGLRAALSSSFDLVVTDLDMPEMDGFEMTEIILSELGSKAPPVLAFTAHAVQGFKERCQEAGMVGYVAKPVRPGKLLSAVRKSLRPAGTVLVVDDSGDNRMLVDRHLSKEGFTVEEATGGHEAIERIRAGGVDLVLLDMNMPELDGYETARRIRALPGRGDVPVLAMTSWVGAEEQERCLEAGCTAYLEKPIRRARLLELTRELLAAEPPPVGTEPAEEAVQVDPAIADLVPEFLEGRRQDAARLRELLRAADLDAIRVLAHNLAGSGAPYGFPRLTELGRTLESVALEGDPGDVSRWLDELDSYLETVRWEVGTDE